MTPQCVFISRKDDPLTGTHSSYCNHKCIGLFLVKSGLDESQDAFGVRRRALVCSWQLLVGQVAVFLPVIALPADLARPTDLMAAALCQSQLQPVSNIWFLPLSADTQFPAGAFKSHQSLLQSSHWHFTLKADIGDVKHHESTASFIGQFLCVDKF